MFAWLMADLLGASAMNADPVPPARDGNIAIQEELDAARCKKTVAAYDLFIARHPDHPLAKRAREERQLLVRKPAAPQG